MAINVVVVAALCGFATSTHYEKPPCQSDEVAGHLPSGGELCAPKCNKGTCPMDVPSGTKAQPQCVLKAVDNTKYCALVCQSGSECPAGGQCEKGVCTFAMGASLTSQANEDAQKKFEEFGAAFGRFYKSTKERHYRFGIFADNLNHVEKMQNLDSSAVYSHVTPLADWSVEEFLARNTLKAQLFDRVVTEQDQIHNASLPDSFDWRQKGAVNEVKNQGQCGSCWAFSTVDNIEGVNFVKTQKLLSLSEQELVDCDHNGDEGCQGGLPSNAFKYLISTKTGLESETKYPYTGRGGTCNAQKADELVFISSWKQISTDENQIAAALIQYGPLSIGINAGPMQFYFGGIADPWALLCNPKALDHGVAIVGFGSESKPYWIIRNSWGKSWGEQGYYRIVRGKGKCGLNTMVTTATVASSGDALVV